MTGRTPAVPERSVSVPTAIRALGLSLFAGLFVLWAVFDRLHLQDVLALEAAVSLLTNGVPALGIVYGGYRLERGGLAPGRYPRVGKWCVGGLALFLAVNLLIMAAFPLPTLEENVGWAYGVSIFGAVGGLAIGGVEARAIDRGRAAERAAVRAEHVEAQRQWLDHLNGLLRHEVLNTANVIEGYADLLIDEDHDELTAGRLKTIRRQSRDMTAVIRDVRVLIEATGDVGEFSVVDVAAVLSEELTDLRATHAEVEIEATFGNDLYVVADDLLPRVFANLLSNAVGHNDSETPVVRVAAETTDESVAIRIADDGPGIPEDRLDGLFEREKNSGSSHGLGLYLVCTLVERYGGAVELTETGPDGSVFTVTLPRPPEEDRPIASAPPRVGTDEVRAVDAA